jgi:hypothetical protein
MEGSACVVCDGTGTWAVAGGGEWGGAAAGAWPLVDPPLAHPASASARRTTDAFMPI